MERAFQTLQDRLVKALRLDRIDTLEAANALLPRFIAHYNARFGKAPRCPDDAHRGLKISPEHLLWITSEQHARTLSKSLSCQYRGRQYLIQTAGAPAYHLRGARITVRDDGTHESIVLQQGKPLSYRVFARHDLPPRIADDKTVDAHIETAKRRQASAPPTPAANHPWRKPATAPPPQRTMRPTASP